MSIANNNHVDMNILNLPDEILRIIFNKLRTIDTFYSLVGVNERFDRLALDPLYIHHLNFLVDRSDPHTISVDVHIRDEICKKILPRINDKVTKLTAGPFFMRSILGAVHCSQVYSLSLVGYAPDLFLEHLASPMMCRLFNEQITHLSIAINPGGNVTRETGRTIFKAILLHGEKLTNLTLFQLSPRGNFLTFSSWNVSCTTSLSPTLTILTIYVNTFDDCLLLLNGCLQSLSTLIIYIKEIKHSLSKTENIEKLVKLISFSLETRLYTDFYEQQIIPLLRRMLNLEQLTLHLPVIRHESTYIDGNHLYDEILQYMPRLNKFIFNIHTLIINKHVEMNLPSNDDIRNSFIKTAFHSMDAYADEKLIKHAGNCHIYSLPYIFKEFLFMSSCFQGGQFSKVEVLRMIDERPFEHKLFKIISKDFPFLQKLIICNFEPQQNKQDDSSTLITFNHLFDLTLTRVHSDYVIQFLSDKNTCLPCLTHLSTDYDILVTVTNNFTTDEKLLNCAKIKYLSAWNLLRDRPQNFNSYFPSLSRLKLLV